MIRIALVCVLTLCLAGCYVSKTALITPADASYPVPSGTHFDSFVPRGHGWGKRAGRTLYRQGDYYIYVVDGDPKRSTPFLFKKIAKNRYVVQINDASDLDKVSEYYYQLIDFDGKTAVQYSSDCYARREWIEQKLIAKVEDTQPERCLFDDFEKLAKVLVDAKRYFAPEARYVVAPAPAK